MRAVVLERYGTAREALVFHPDHPMPERKPGQVLIEAAATSMNQGEWKLRQVRGWAWRIPDQCDN